MFFTQINQLMNQSVDITLVIRKKEGQLMVSTMPKANGLKDEAQNFIVPLNLTGTPEELDAEFITLISQPIQKAAGLLTNMSNYEKQAEKAAENAKAAKEKKEKEEKVAKDNKEKFDKLVKNATEYEASKKYADALNSLIQAKAFATPQALKTLEYKISNVRAKHSQGSLFGINAEEKLQEFVD